MWSSGCALSAIHGSIWILLCRHERSTGMASLSSLPLGEIYISWFHAVLLLFSANRESGGKMAFTAGDFTHLKGLRVCIAAQNTLSSNISVFLAYGQITVSNLLLLRACWVYSMSWSILHIAHIAEHGAKKPPQWTAVLWEKMHC